MLTFVFALAIAASPAIDIPAASMFGVAAVPDTALAAARGGTPFATLTRGKVASMVDVQGRSDFRFAGGLARIEMDVWWGTVGSELIATSIRNAGQ